MSETALFDMEHSDLIPEPVDERSAIVRLRDKRASFIARGFHPLANLIPGLLLHRDAHKERDGEGPRCGDCKHRTRVGHGSRDYNKCGFYASAGSSQSDLALWWPACIRFEQAAAR